MLQQSEIRRKTPTKIFVPPRRGSSEAKNGVISAVAKRIQLPGVAESAIPEIGAYGGAATGNRSGFFREFGTAQALLREGFFAAVPP